MNARLIEFRTETQAPGTVTISDAASVIDGPAAAGLQSIVDAYRNRTVVWNRTAGLDGFADFYADWSNGYVSSREIVAAPGELRQPTIRRT